MDLIDRAERICGAGLGDRVLRERLVAALAERVAFDGHVFAFSDPVTGVLCSPHATVPEIVMEQLPELIQRRYRESDADFSGWLARFGVTDRVNVPLADRYGNWGFIELWSLGSTFSVDDRALLAALAPVVTRGLREAAARTFLSQEELDVIEPGVVLLDPGLRVRSQTDAAAAALLRLLPPDDPVPPVPAAAYNVGAALLAQEGGVAWEPSARVHLGGNRWVTVRASRLGADIAVSIAPSSPAERTDLFARVHGLSPRETEVLGLAVHGLDSRAIADLLIIAPTTAEDHLKALLAKAGAPSRQVLLARALGA